MAPKFVLCDLDGTLLDLPNGISTECLQRLNRLISEGLNFSIATGRDFKKAKKALQGVDLKLPVILTNGALLVDFNTGEFLEVTYIEAEIFQTILGWAQEFHLKPIVLISFDPIAKEVHFNKGKWGHKGIKYLNNSQIAPFLSERIVSLQFHAQKNVLDPLAHQIEAEYQHEVNIIFIEDVSYKHYNIPGEWYWLEINSKEAGKANMLKKLAAHLGVALEDFVVFGDNLNDIGMMQLAGLGVAVADANPEVIQIAHNIAPEHTKCGVIEYLEKNKQLFISTNRDNP